MEKINQDGKRGALRNQTNFDANKEAEQLMMEEEYNNTPLVDLPPMSTITELLSNNIKLNEYLSTIIAAGGDLKCSDAVQLIVDYSLLFDGFDYRYGQREVITFMVERWIADDRKPIVLEAPTGSGKSIIILAAIMSYRMVQYVNGVDELSKAYILTPEIMLQKQYKNDLETFNQTKFDSAILMGANNYTCHMNGFPYRSGECFKKRLKSNEQAKLPCAKKCEYLLARENASNKKVTVMNYHNWLLYMNVVNEIVDEEKQKFPMRDVVCFDEAHKIDPIITDVFSTKINITKFIHHLILIADILQSHRTANFVESNVGDVDAFEKMLRESSHKLDDGFKIITKMTNTFNQYNSLIDLILSNDSIFDESFGSNEMANVFELMGKSFKGVGDEESDNPERPDDIKQCEESYEVITKIRTEFIEYVSNIKEVGIIHMVLDIKYDYDNQTTTIELRNSNASALCKKYIHSNYNYALFTSATFGTSLEDYAKSIGLDDFYPIRLPSTWDFKNSPIIHFGSISMTRRNLEKSLPKMVSIIDQLLSTPQHANQRGIIHTGNYAIMDYIIENSIHRERLLSYKGTKEKISQLGAHANSVNGVILGPGLTEGLDLKHDLARFMIIAKTPFPYLGDALVKAKSDNQPTWYNWTTSTTLHQMLGRPVRAADDWCITYVIDDTARKFLFGYGVPQHIQSRYKQVFI